MVLCEQSCVMVNGAAQCICTEPGTERNPRDTRKCRERDECHTANGKSPCGIHSVCKNGPGNFTCVCDKHWILDVDSQACSGEEITSSNAVATYVQSTRM